MTAMIYNFENVQIRLQIRFIGTPVLDDVNGVPNDPKTSVKPQTERVVQGNSWKDLRLPFVENPSCLMSQNQDVRSKK